MKQIHQQQQKLQVEEMRGPSDEAGRKRRLFRTTVEDALENQGIPSSVPPDEVACLPQSDFAAILYTDGSCGDQGSTTAGWGLFVSLPDGTEQYCAPVSILDTEPLFHGACQHSNSTGELEALGVALKWIHTYVQPNSAVQICFDSQYAANMVRGLWQPESNLSLIQWCRWQLARVQSKGICLDWKWIRGHQGVHGNEMADRLAKQGSRGEVKVFPALQVPDQSTPLPMSGMIPPRVRHTYKHGGPQPRPPWNGLDSPWFMDGEFANTEPLIPWDTLSSIMVDAAQNVLGRKVPRMGAPYSDEDLHEISEMREDLALLWSRLQESSSPAEQQRVKHQHRMLSRQLQRFRSKARSRFVRHLCTEAEQHIRFHDMGRFYKSLKKIGVHLSDHTVAGKVDHDITALRSHCQAVSGSVQEVSDAVLDHVPWGTVAHWLGHTPSPAEVRLAVRRLRDCSPGRDEVTAGMLQWAGPRAMDCVISIIQSLWVSQPDVWPHSVKQGIRIYLHKKGDRQDLGNYRVIMLLPLISRVLARIVATRLQHWSEQSNFLHNFQWGFRPNRRCTDPALVLTLLLEMANGHIRRQEDSWDPLVLVLWDIVKAYPSTQRHICWKLFHKLGVPETMLRVLYGLHDCTDYVIRSGDEYSEPFSLAIGLREGCPSSPVCFSIFHNFAIGRFLHRQAQAGNRGVHCTLNPQAPFHLRRQLAGKPEQLDSLDFFCFTFC